MAFEFHHYHFVIWQDTDAAGIIHFTNCFPYMEEVETHFQRSLDSEFWNAGQPGICCLRISVSCDFIKPVTFGDESDIHLWMQKKGHSSIDCKMLFRHNGKELVHGRSTTVYMNKDGVGKMKSVPISSILNWFLKVVPFAKINEGSVA